MELNGNIGNSIETTTYLFDGIERVCQCYFEGMPYVKEDIVMQRSFQWLNGMMVMPLHPENGFIHGRDNL